MNKLNYRSLTIVLFSMILFTTNCKKDSNNQQAQIKNVVGYVQKGPFLSGGTINVIDLQSNLSPTGKTFYCQVLDDKGTFQLNNIVLSSNYVNLSANGYYFNEIAGETSLAPITLNVLTDISGKSNININLLTQLEIPRVEYLVNSGKSFNSAKIQAQKEVLSIFNIVKNDSVLSENLDISQGGSDNGILLAASLILQGYRTESEITELVSKISNNISKTGVLSNDSLGSALINHAVYLDTISIRNNLQSQYNSLAVSTDIPVFGKYISNFISSTKFQVTQTLVNFPETGLYGKNILYLADTIFNAGTNYSFAATLPPYVKVLTIKLTTLKNSALWSYYGSTAINWSFGELVLNGNYSELISTISSGQSSDAGIIFDKGLYLIDYFENNSINPTRSKTITVQ